MRWAAVVVLITLVGCTTPIDPVDSSRPTWEAGYAWSYVYDDRHIIAEGEDGDWDNVTVHDVGRRIVEVLNATGPYVLMEYREGQDGRVRDIGVVRVDDLAWLPSSYLGHVERCRGDVCTLEPGDLDYADAPTYIDFPLESNKDWRSLTETHITQGIVESGAIVETVIGSVHTARVVLETTPIDPDAAARALREEGERNGFTIDVAETDDLVRHVLYYSDEYLAVVQSEVRSTQAIRVAGTDPDGQPFSFASEETRITRENLDGARLVARSERPIDDLARYLTGRLDVRDPAGQAVSSGYDIAINGTNATVNAAAGPQLTYNAIIKGQLPATDVLEWRLIDADGNAIVQGAGPRFDVNLTLPGRLTVELQAKRGGDVVAAAGLPLIADWNDTVSKDCGPAAVGGATEACPVIYVPVHSGVRDLAIAVTPSGPSAESGGLLRLRDSAGAVISGAGRDGTYYIAVDDFRPYTVDERAWTLEYQPHAGIATSIEALVDVRYSGNEE